MKSEYEDSILEIRECGQRGCKDRNRNKTWYIGTEFIADR